jgi:hypothetical protein
VCSSVHLAVYHASQSPAGTRCPAPLFLVPASGPSGLHHSSALHPSAEPQTENQCPVLPEEGIKAHSPINNLYVDPSVRQLVGVNKAANTIHSPEDGPTKDCYGWDPMLNGDSNDTVSNQDLDMPDNPHREISGNTRRMMDQQFAPQHTPALARTSCIWRTPLTMSCNN